MYKFDVPLRLVNFVKGLSDGFVDKLIDVAIAHANSSQVSKRVKLLFDTACRSEFQVKGFRSASTTAIPALVKRPLVDSIKRSESVVWATINVWLEARNELRLVCQEFLEKKGVPCIEFQDLKYGFNYAVLDHELESLVTELHTVVSKVDKDELRLMLVLLQGHVPMTADEIKDYPGVDMNSTGRTSTTSFNGKTKFKTFPDNSFQLSLPKHVADMITTERDEQVPIVSPNAGERFRDTVTALNTLSGNLNKAKDLLTKGDIEKLGSWAEEFQQATQNTLALWGKERAEFQKHVGSIISEINKSQIHEPDKEKFVRRVTELFSQSKNNPYLVQNARKSIAGVEQEAQKYVKSIQLELDNLLRSLQSLESAGVKAKAWEIETAIWLTQSCTIEQAKKQSLEDIVHGIKINRELAEQIQSAVEEAKRELISRLLQATTDLLSIASDEQKPRIEMINEKIYIADSRSEFLSLEIELSKLLDEISSSQLQPDVVEAAKMYQIEPDVVYLDLLLDSLAKNRRHGDVYLLLTSLFLKGLWPSGTELDKTVVDSYLTGFQEHTPVHEICKHLIILLRETQLVNQAKIEAPTTSLGLAILYLSALAVYPNCLNPNDLWQIHSDEIKMLSPLWARLLDQTLQGDLPVIRSSQTLPAEELRQVVSYLDSDLKKENGRYVRVRGRNSIVMTNMEQQNLLPLLDEKWQKLKNAEVGTDLWKHLKNWVFETDSSLLFESVCHDANIAPNESPFYRPNFEERIQKDFQHFEKFINLKEEIEGIKSSHFVMIEDALDALQKASKALNDVYTGLAQLILGSLEGDRNFEVQSEPMLPVILERSLLESSDYWSSMPNAVVVLGNYDAFNSQSDDLVKAIVSSLADPLPPGELPEFYLIHNLPHIAECLNSELDFQRRVSELKQKNKENLQTRTIELKKWRKSLTDQEERWLSSQRWNLLFAKMDSRIEEMRNYDVVLAEQSQEKYKQLINDVNQLEIPIMQAGFIPPASKDELHIALDEIKTVCRRGYANCIELAVNLLVEVKHILDYKDANLEGVIRVHTELSSVMNNRIQPKELDSSSLTMSSYIDALRSGNYESVGINHSIYSESMIEDRIDLLKSWESMRGYPLGDLQSEAQYQDLRHFFSLFAKIIQVQYGIATAGKPSHYFFRNPVVHFESSLMKPGTDALRRNLVFLALTGDINPRVLKELDRVMVEEEWLAKGKFIVWFVLENPDIAHDWVRRKYNGKSVVVIDEGTLLNILFAGDNPTSSGNFKRMLLRTVDTHSVSVFWYENWVDNDRSIFVGREDWIRSILESGQSHAVYGGRRIGKSSLLKAIERELNQTGIIAIYIDLEGARSLKEGITAAQDILERLEIYEPCETFTDFHKHLTKHFQKNPEQKVVILFDELDPYIRERRKNKESHTLIETCRNLFSEHRSNIRFIMAGFIELWNQLRGDGDISGQQNPYKNFLNDRGPLAALRSSEAQRIVKEGFQETLGFKITDPSIPRRIVDATTGHPAFVQKFCERLHNRLHGLGADVTEVQVRDVDSIRGETDHLSFTSFVVETLDLNLNKLSQIVVYLLAANNKEQFSVEEIFSILTDYEVSSLTKEKLHESVQELLITGVFSTAETQSVYKFSVPGYADLLRQYEVADKDYILNLIQKYNEGISHE